MGKKDATKKAGNANVAAADVKLTSVGQIHYDAAEHVLEDAAKIVHLPHIAKPWTREAWENARPWVLEQRQKLEAMGWTPTDTARTELYVLKKNAPQGSYTDDGLVYIRMPKKFIDFHRSGRKDEDQDPNKKRRAISKRREAAPGYEISDPLVWRLRIDGDTEDAGREPSVVFDVPDAMENLVYLVMALQPGLVRLTASRENVIQPGTRQSLAREDAPVATVRYTAMVAASEHYVRYLPPAFWFKRNSEQLRKIMGDPAFDATLAAAEESTARGAIRTVKGVEEQTWEEVLKGPDGKPIQTANPDIHGTKPKKSKKAKAAMADTADTAAAGLVQGAAA